MAWGHLFVFGLPLTLTALAMFTQSPVMASNAMYFWYICYDLGYQYMAVGVSLLFTIMMASSWEFYVSSDSIYIAQVGYELHAMAKSDLFFYWASQAMYHTFVNKRTLRMLRLSLVEAANGVETTQEEESETTTVFDNQDDDGNITF